MQSVFEKHRDESREHWTFNVTLAAQDKNLLKSFVVQELAFYNGLVQGFATRLRAFPDTLLNLTGAWEDYFADLAMLGVNPRRLTTPKSLPDMLARYRPLLFDDAGKVKEVPERMMLLFELAMAGGNIHPQARRAMVLEMIRFYRQQAQVTTAAVPHQLRDEQTYKVAPETLEPLDQKRKRHVQLPRGAVTVKYIAKENATDFSIPYVKTPLKVPGDHTNHPWNLLILRQTTDALDAPWQLELRKSAHTYLIKVFDHPHRPKAR